MNFKSYFTVGTIEKYDWQLIPQEVTWQEAIQAWMDGKEIRCDVANASFKYDLICHFMKDVEGLPLSRSGLRDGKWYIL